MSEKSFAFVLNVSEGKRLIAKGVKALPCVQNALTNGTVIVASGITNAYVAEELTGQSIDKTRYAAGVIADGRWGVTPDETRLSPIVLEKGTISSRSYEEALTNFTADDVFIKGANAIDLEGNAGVLLGSPTGGTCGTALGTIYATGCHLIVPASLEKLIPSVPVAVESLGIHHLDDCLGQKVGMMPLFATEIITEVEALELLFDVEAVPVSAGGVGGSEGSIGIVVRGQEEEIAKVIDLIKTIKGEPPISNPLSS